MRARYQATVPLVADVLVREFGVRRVVLFGSWRAGLPALIRTIDIALEGLPPGQTFHAMARAAEVAGRNVDLVPLEGARPAVLAIIDREGEVSVTTANPVSLKLRTLLRQLVISDCYT